jgi:hypothetical protein
MLFMRANEVALEDISLTTQKGGARGALLLADAGPRGALLLKRGRLRVGVDVGPETTKLNLSADEAWLTRSVAELSLPQSP